METYQAHGNEDLSTHGDSGPIQVSPGGHRTDIGDQFLAMAAKYDPERGFTDDVNDFKSCNAYGVSLVEILLLEKLTDICVPSVGRSVYLLTR